MRKFYKRFYYVVFIFVFLLITLISLHCAIVVIFKPFIQKYVQTKTVHEIKFDSFYISPSLGLTFKNVRIDDMATMRKVTIRISPIKIFMHIASPADYISRVSVSKLEISLSKSFKNNCESVKKKDSAVKLPSSKITLFADEIVVKNSSDFLKITDTNILINPAEITINSVINLYDVPVKFISNIERAENNILKTSSNFTSKNKIDLLINLNGTIDLSSLNIYQDIAVKKLKYIGFKLGDSTGAFSKVDNAYEMYLTGNFGRYDFNSLDGQSMTKAKIDISKVSNIISGSAALKLKTHDGVSILDFNTRDLSVFGYKCGNFDLYGRKNNEGIYKMLCSYGIGKKVEMNFHRKGIYDGKLIIGNVAVGAVSGDIKTGVIAIDIKNVDVKDMPIIPFVWKNDKGKVNILGAIDKVSGRIDFGIRDFKAPNVNENITATLTRDNNRYAYAFDFHKAGNSVASLNGVFKNNGKIISADFKFAGVNIMSLLHIFGQMEHNISGMASGRLKYEKNLMIDFDIKAFNGVFFGNKFKKIEAKGNVRADKINIERFVLMDYSNEISADASGVLGFTKANPTSFFNVNMKNINVGAVKVSGNSVFNGNLGKKNKIKGTIKIADTNLSGVSLGNISTNTVISMKRLEIYNLKSDNGIKAYLIANFEKNKLSGNIYFDNARLYSFHRNLSGFLDSSINLSGDLIKPDIKVEVSIEKGKYLSHVFSFFSEFAYKNGAIEISKAILLADKTKITAKGNYLNGGVLLRFDNLTEKLINMLIGFQVPITGSFSGEGIIAEDNNERYLKMSSSAKNACVKTIKLSDVKFNVKLSGENMAVSGSCAKFLDSEIKVNDGFFNINNGKYGFDLFLVNVHVGPIDLFGNIKSAGKIIKSKDKTTYAGTVDLHDLWINKYKLSHSCFDYSIKDKTLIFAQKVRNEDLYKSSGSIVFKNTVFAEYFGLSNKGGTSFNLKANFLNDSMNLKIKGSNIGWDFITNSLNLPNILTGSVNINMNLSGNIRNPKGNISVTSVSGLAIGVPYDNLNIELDFLNNYVRINKADLFKRNGINISAKGFCPLCFDETLSAEMRKNPVNVSFEIKDRKLDILKYLSKGYITPLKGAISLKGSIAGNYEKINGNGKLSITEGAFGVKDYLGKVKDMSVEISLAKNLIKIDKFNFKSGRGHLDVFGHLELDNFHVKNFDIRLVTNDKGIFLRVPQMPIPNFIGYKLFLQDCSNGEPRFDVTIKGTPKKNKISGWVLLENTRFTFPGTKENENLNLVSLEGTEFDLELKSGKNTKFENSFVSALINGSVRISGPYNGLEAKGTVETSNGKIDYLGLIFDVLNAKMRINGNKRIYISAECETNLQSKTKNEMETIKLTIAKTKLSELSERSIKFSSKDDPYMDPRKALEKIAGTDQDINAGSRLEAASNSVIRQQALRLIDQSLTMPIARTILRRTGLVDNLRISYIQTDDDVSSHENPTLKSLLAGTKYSLEKNLTNQMLLGYSLIFDDIKKESNLRHEIEMMYKFKNNLFLSGSYELGVDRQDHPPDRKVMFNHQIRFGFPRKNTSK